MASPNCWRCLVRPSLAAAPAAPRLVLPALLPRNAVAAATTSFSTSAPANAKVAEPGLGKHVRAGKKMRLSKFKKKKDHDRGKAPLPGERKAFRKRVQLSNNNALEVPGLSELTLEVMADPASAGQVLAIPAAVVDQLRQSEAFKPTQCWGMFRQPALLLRGEAVQLMQRLGAAAEKKEVLRMIITGERRSGKSTMLLSAMAHAYLNNWVVINIPEAQELTTACTEYVRIANTEPQQYSQPTYVLKLLQAIHRNHERVLSQFSMARSHPELPPNLHRGANLAQLVGSAKETDHAWPVFRAFWAELTTPGVPRPPVLLALDGVAHAMRLSDYRSPAFELIHAHDLALLRVFVDALSGATPLPHGGAVLAAETRGNAPRAPSLELAVAQREAAQLGRPAPAADPYFRGYDARVDAALQSVEVLRLAGVSKAEARALMEYWAAGGLLRAQVDERTVSERWTMAGSGVVGEIERVSLQTLRL